MDRFMTAEVIRQSKLTDEQKEALHRKCIRDLEIEIEILIKETLRWKQMLWEHEAELIGYELGQRCPCSYCDPN